MPAPVTPTPAWRPDPVLSEALLPIAEAAARKAGIGALPDARVWVSVRCRDDAAITELECVVATRAGRWGRQQTVTDIAALRVGALRLYQHAVRSLATDVTRAAVESPT